LLRSLPQAVSAKSLLVKFQALKRSTLKVTSKSQNHLPRSLKTRVRSIMQCLLRRQEGKETDTEIPTGLPQKSPSLALFISMQLEPNNSGRTILKVLLAILLKYCQVSGKFYQIEKRNLSSRLLSSLFRHITIKSDLKSKHLSKSTSKRGKI
jgi:hypothetical protein